MPGVARVTLDQAGGVQLGHQNPTVFANGANIVVLGDIVASHPSGYPHIASPPMVTASSTVFACGIPVCRQGDVAACGHASSGSGDVFADDVS